MLNSQVGTPKLQVMSKSGPPCGSSISIDTFRNNPEKLDCQRWTSIFRPKTWKRLATWNLFWGRKTPILNHFSDVPGDFTCLNRGFSNEKPSLHSLADRCQALRCGRPARPLAVAQATFKRRHRQQIGARHPEFTFVTRCAEMVMWWRYGDDPLINGSIHHIPMIWDIMYCGLRNIKEF